MVYTSELSLFSNGFEGVRVWVLDTNRFPAEILSAGLRPRCERL